MHLKGVDLTSMYLINSTGTPRASLGIKNFGPKILRAKPPGRCLPVQRPPKLGAKALGPENRHTQECMGR
jgi:hypothetical protein